MDSGRRTGNSARVSSHPGNVNSCAEEGRTADARQPADGLRLTAHGLAQQLQLQRGPSDVRRHRVDAPGCWWVSDAQTHAPDAPHLHAGALDHSGPDGQRVLERAA